MIIIKLNDDTRKVFASALRFWLRVREGHIQSALHDFFGIQTGVLPATGSDLPFPDPDLSGWVLDLIEGPLTDEIRLEAGPGSVQSRFVLDALDVYSRMGMGQLESITHQIFSSRDFRRALLAVKLEHFGFSSGQSLSMRSEEVPEKCRIAYDMYQVIRRLQHELSGGPSWSVWSDPFWATSSAAKIEGRIGK